MRRDACYHATSNAATAAEAEVSCAMIGGRLASFVRPQELVDLRNAMTNLGPRTDLWLGVYFHHHTDHYFNQLILNRFQDLKKLENLELIQ
jgi:hypothetical protein